MVGAGNLVMLQTVSNIKATEIVAPVCLTMHRTHPFNITAIFFSTSGVVINIDLHRLCNRLYEVDRLLLLLTRCIKLFSQQPHEYQLPTIIRFRPSL